VLLEEVPKKIAGRDVLGGLADEVDKRFLSGPGMPAILDHDQDHLSPLLAATICSALDRRAVCGFGRQFHDLGLLTATVDFCPSLNRILHGLEMDELGHAIARTAEGDECVGCAVETENRNGPLGVRLFDQAAG
jgi:hypothetical protein